LDRDDIFELAERLDNVTDAIDDVGDMVFLHGITEPLDPVTEQARVLLRAAEHTSQGMHSLEQLDLDRLNAYLTAVHDLEYEGDQLHRRVRAQLDDFTTGLLQGGGRLAMMEDPAVAVTTAASGSPRCTAPSPPPPAPGRRGRGPRCRAGSRRAPPAPAPPAQ
jgi:Protein of unknown function DUF47